MSGTEQNRLGALWHMYDDNVAQSRHHENERKAVVGVVVTIGAALTSVITYDGAIGGLNDVYLCLFMAAIGIFGASFSYKNFERSCYHFERARGFRDRIDTEFLNGEFSDIHRTADSNHGRQFRYMKKFRLHLWWVSLNLVVTLIAVALGATAATSIQ